MREAFNDIMAKNVQRPPHVHDSFHGTAVLYFEAGKIVKAEITEKLRIKPQHDMSIRKILEENG